MVEVLRSETRGTAAQQRRMSIALLAKPGGAQTGVGRYSASLAARLAAAEVEVNRLAPSLPPLGPLYSLVRRAGVDARTFLSNYPLWANYPKADVYHLAAQNLASVLLFRRPPGPLIVTVHDIFPYMLRDTPGLSVYRSGVERLIDKLAMSGLHRADLLLADSTYTAECLTKYLGLPASRIRVAHLGIDGARFRPVEVSIALRERYNLPHGPRYLIYVGSEDPRKNLPMLVRALALLRQQAPDVRLIKVGRAHFAAERDKLNDLAEHLGLTGAISFTEDVAEEDLPALYNLADVAVLPSLYEGFGFGALEAQACGVPLVYADAASLPEISGGAGLAFKPGPGAERVLATAILSILADPALANDLRERGRANAARFTWDETARATAAAYRSVQRGASKQ